MKEILDQVESYLESLLEGNVLRIFGSVDAERELIRQFVAEMASASIVDNQDTLVAPNYYSLNVSTTFFSEIRSNQSLLDKLSRHLTAAGDHAGLRFQGKVNIAVFPDRSLAPGEFTVKAIVRDAQLSDTAPSLNPYSSDSFIQPTPRAFFIVGGTKIFTIEDDIINIGRQLDNDLVINQPRVSRRHAQVRQVKGRHMIFDLDSSGGTFVNEKRITQIQLHPGDVISLAGVPLVYGHDTVSSISDTEEYLPLSKDKHASASTTSTKVAQDDTDSQNLIPD